MLTEVFTPAYYRENLRVITLPVKAADYLLAHPLAGNLYNHYIWGGYLIYRLYPHYKVFIDGRAVLYGKQLFRDEIAISSGAPDSMKLLDQYGIRTLVVGPDFFRGDTARKLGWALVYRDEASSIYHRDEGGK